MSAKKQRPSSYGSLDVSAPGPTLSDDLKKVATGENPRKKGRFAAAGIDGESAPRFQMLMHPHLLQQLKDKAGRDRRYVTDLVIEALVNYYGFSEKP